MCLDEADTPPAGGVNLAVLVADVRDDDRPQDHHRSLVLVCGTSCKVHVFDTVYRQSDKVVAQLVDAIAGKPLFVGGQGFTLCNHTGQVRQTGGTCGAWTAWLAFALSSSTRGAVTALTRLWITGPCRRMRSSHAGRVKFNHSSAAQKP